MKQCVREFLYSRCVLHADNTGEMPEVWAGDHCTERSQTQVQLGRVQKIFCFGLLLNYEFALIV